MPISRSVNDVTLIGNLVKDPEVKIQKDGTVMTTFCVATNKTWKTQGGRLQEKSEFHNIVTWNRLAEISADILAGGMLVYIKGEITYQIFDMDGIKMQRAEIRASDMKIMDTKGKPGANLIAKPGANSDTTETSENENVLSNGVNNTQSNMLDLSDESEDEIPADAEELL